MSGEAKQSVSGKGAASSYDEQVEDVDTSTPAIDLSNNVQAQLVAMTFILFIAI